MSVSIFLSRPNPVTPNQETFLDALTARIHDLDLMPKTLGVNEYGVEAPLSTVRMLMSESNGFIVVAMRRYRSDVVYKLTRAADGSLAEKDLEINYLTSPWCQIEPGMAFQLGLPMLIMREAGVLADGVFERGVVGMYMPEIDIETNPTGYLDSPECKSLLQQFSSEAHQYRKRRGSPF